MRPSSGVAGYISSVRSGDTDPDRYISDLMTKLKVQSSRLGLFSKLNETPEVGADGVLPRLPFSVKDNICVRDFLTRAGSRILDGYTPPFDATVVERMRAAGGVFLGTTNMDEFGFGTFSTNCGWGKPKNPFDDGRSCGGSSGGAAGATAILSHHVALAESTGGSISCPASFCGVVGFTPTYGRVSRYGLIDYANSLDKIGLMARSIADIALVLPIIAGPDEKDPTSLAQPPLELGDDDIRTIAVPEELVGSIENDGIISLFWDAAKQLEEKGIEVVKVSMPMLRFSIPAYYILACAEASTNLARYCGMRYGRAGRNLEDMYNTYFTEVRTESLGEEAKRRIMLGTFARMAGYRDKYYMKALSVRRSIIEEFKRVLGEYDLIATPTMPILPPEFDAIRAMSPATVYALDFLTVPPNLAGLPHLSMPLGYLKGLPVGLHFLADHWDESKLLSVGEVWESGFRYQFPMSLEGGR